LANFLSICETVFVLCIAQVFSQGCVPPTSPPQTSCAVLNTSMIPACAPYLPYKSILVTPETPLQVLIFIAEEQISKLAALPSNCGVPLTEMICHLVFQECVEIPLAPGFNVSLPRTPCQSTCYRSNDRCAQLFASGGQVGQDCDAVGPTCAPLFVQESTSYTLVPGTPPIVLPCQPPIAPIQPPVFYCEKWKGKPSACSPYLDHNSEYAFSIYFDQHASILAAENATSSLAAVPSACQLTAYEFICRNIFRKCVVETKDGLPTPFYYGEAVCESECHQFNVQCGELFGLSGSSLTQCNAFSAATNNSMYPKTHSVYKYGTTIMDVPCTSTSLTKAERPPFFACTEWKGQPEQCKPYLSVNSNPHIFYIDAFQLDARVNLTATFIAMLQELPKACRNYGTEMICRTLLQECQSFDADDLPSKQKLPCPCCRFVFSLLSNFQSQVLHRKTPMQEDL
jgi:hypothetical protein